ncbi:hypothetical protein CVT24_002246 [Panaeolus cyanescens]|uniref:Uncharacterized protein n=1 Tax=Panaeolus cyanescens TaxID=181874 RepID=A0A409YIF1_9AGAR|nr:hypothetical protein CVT24_002246 [Panaeolus cyanescens]
MTPSYSCTVSSRFCLTRLTFLHVFLLSALFPLTSAIQNITILSSDSFIAYEPSQGSWNAIGDSGASNGAFWLTRMEGGTATITATFRSVHFTSPLWPFPVLVDIAVISGSDEVVHTIDLTDYSVPMGIAPPTGLTDSSRGSEVRWSFHDLDASGGGANRERTVRVSAAMSESGWIGIVDSFIFEVAGPGDPPLFVPAPLSGSDGAGSGGGSTSTSAGSSSDTGSGMTSGTSDPNSTTTPPDTTPNPNLNSTTSSANANAGATSNHEQSKRDAKVRIAIITGAVCGALVLFVIPIGVLWLRRRGAKRAMDDFYEKRGMGPGSVSDVEVGGAGAGASGGRLGERDVEKGNESESNVKGRNACDYGAEKALPNPFDDDVTTITPSKMQTFGPYVLPNPVQKGDDAKGSGLGLLNTTFLDAYSHPSSSSIPSTPFSTSFPTYSQTTSRVTSSIQPPRPPTPQPYTPSSVSHGMYPATLALGFHDDASMSTFSFSAVSPFRESGVLGAHDGYGFGAAGAEIQMRMRMVGGGCESTGSERGVEDGKSGESESREGACEVGSGNGKERYSGQSSDSSERLLTTTCGGSAEGAVVWHAIRVGVGYSNGDSSSDSNSYHYDRSVVPEPIPIPEFTPVQSRRATLDLDGPGDQLEGSRLETPTPHSPYPQSRAETPNLHPQSRAATPGMYGSRCATPGYAGASNTVTPSSEFGSAQWHDVVHGFPMPPHPHPHVTENAAEAPGLEAGPSTSAVYFDSTRRDSCWSASFPFPVPRIPLPGVPLSVAGGHSVPYIPRLSPIPGSATPTRTAFQVNTGAAPVRALPAIPTSTSGSTLRPPMSGSSHLDDDDDDDTVRLGTVTTGQVKGTREGDEVLVQPRKPFANGADDLKSGVGYEAPPTPPPSGRGARFAFQLGMEGSSGA